jgi:branched-chain amino acid transport system permease protein
MDISIFAILVQDGITNGLIYVLLALATIVTFSVTRITFIPQGDFVAMGALTLASVAAGKTPGTVWLLIGLGFVAAAIEMFRAPRRSALVDRAKAATWCLAPGLLMAALCAVLPLAKLPMPLRIVLVLAIVVPVGPLLYRIVYRPIADASILSLLIVSAALHYLIKGLNLYFFGPEGVRTVPLSEAVFNFGDVSVSGQTIVVVVATGLLLFGLHLFFQHTLPGKALRAAASNRVGAELMGISVARSGLWAFALSAFLGAISGVLIGPLITVFYDTGFGIGLRGFAGAIFGGLSSYPLAALGALFIGLCESFAAFYASDLKETIVFLLIIPVLVVLSARHKATED